MTRLLTALLAAAALVCLAATPAMAAKGDKRAATKLLRGTVWTSYESGNVTGATLDRTLTLCRDNSYSLYTAFVAPIIEDPSSYDHPGGDTQVNGTWRVKRAKLSKNRRYGTVKVAYTTEAGERGTIVIAATRSGTTVAGVPATVSRTDAC
jgi:hypothetical protein